LFDVLVRSYCYRHANGIFYLLFAKFRGSLEQNREAWMPSQPRPEVLFGNNPKISWNGWRVASTPSKKWWRLIEYCLVDEQARV